jgi:cytochrome P450
VKFPVSYVVIHLLVVVFCHYKVMREISREELDKLYSKLEAGEESESPGLMEQWLKEGKISEEEAMATAATMFVAGVDTVST